MKATTNQYAPAVTTTKQHTMAAAIATGVGWSESLGLGGLDRRGEFCTRTREISQGGRR